MINKLNRVEIEEVLKSEIIGRIGCHANGKTYIVPISYAYDNGHVYMHTHEGQKINMMRKNPNVCFQVDTMQNMANWKSIIAWGTFEELTALYDRAKAFIILINRPLPVLSSETTHLGPLWPFRSQNVDDVDGIFFRIHLKEMSGRFEKNTIITSYSM